MEGVNKNGWYADQHCCCDDPGCSDYHFGDFYLFSDDHCDDNSVESDEEKQRDEEKGDPFVGMILFVHASMVLLMVH